MGQKGRGGGPRRALLPSREGAAALPGRGGGPKRALLPSHKGAAALPGRGGGPKRALLPSHKGAHVPAGRGPVQPAWKVEDFTFLAISSLCASTATAKVGWWIG
jgi:hypothetical protein